MWVGMGAETKTVYLCMYLFTVLFVLLSEDEIKETEVLCDVDTPKKAGGDLWTGDHRPVREERSEDLPGSEDNDTLKRFTDLVATLRLFLAF